MDDWPSDTAAWHAELESEEIDMERIHSIIEDAYDLGVQRGMGL